MARNGVIEPRLAVVDNRDSTVWITGLINPPAEAMAGPTAASGKKP